MQTKGFTYFFLIKWGQAFQNDKKIKIMEGRCPGGKGYFNFLGYSFFYCLFFGFARLLLFMVIWPGGNFHVEFLMKNGILVGLCCLCFTWL